MIIIIPEPSLGMDEVAIPRSAAREVYKPFVVRRLHRQGVTLIHALEAGARSGMMTPTWDVDSIANLVVEVARNEDVAYVYLTDPQGVVLYPSNPPFKDLLSAWRPRFEDPEQIESRVRRRADVDYLEPAISVGHIGGITCHCH